MTTSITAWALFLSGEIRFCDPTLKAESDAWAIFFGWPSEDGVDHYKRDGWSARQVTISWGDPEFNADHRLAQVTRDAIATFNASRLSKASGGNLPNVNEKVGFANRKAQVNRCVKVARDICAQTFDSKVITPEFWATYWDECWSDDFIAGRGPRSAGHEGWVADFEYLTRPKTMLRVFEKASAG